VAGKDIHDRPTQDVRGRGIGGQRIPAPDQAIRAAISGFSSVTAAATIGTPCLSAICTPP